MGGPVNRYRSFTPAKPLLLRVGMTLKWTAARRPVRPGCGPPTRGGAFRAAHPRCENTSVGYTRGSRMGENGTFAELGCRTRERMDGRNDPRLVLVHAWLTGMRGGEKCLE